ncbi:YtxH domain-containing protein [Dolosigranulum pigrum]|uniref:YtxH domain-containing protein n=1 Tax=Dolosigranulum pigrum TaxID=29394 RepID=UPI001AD867EF|nr:YtxH domain-containing protein [Dolosigranulum pigrum]QTJ44458.1 hypothetical protein FE328_02195 [Dolosigranulum pigrum]
MSFLLGTLAGVALGGVWGLAKTPKSGAKNQEDIKTYFKTIEEESQSFKAEANNLKDAITAIQEEISYLQGPVKEEVEELVDNFTREAQPRLKSIQRHQAKLQQTIENMSEKLED